MKTKLLFASVLALGLAVSQTAHAALNAYLTLKGNKQGEIKGSVTQKGREGKIMVLAVDHQIKPASGKAQHGAFVITKDLDRSTPLLLKAATTGETFDFELQFWTPQLNPQQGLGAEKQHYTVKLTGARITQYNFTKADNRNPETVKYNDFETISFTYERIEWIWTDGPVSTSDTNP